MASPTSPTPARGTPDAADPSSTARKPWLPSERSTGGGWRQSLVPAILAVALLVAANAFAGFLARSTSKSQALVRTKWALVESPPSLAGAPWLILGDSSGNQGVDPRVVSTELGEPCLNLCTIGEMLTVDSAWMLDRWVELHGTPRGVVLVQVYDVWYREPEGGVFGLIPPESYPADPRPPLELPDRERRDMRMLWYAPLVVQRTSIRQALTQPGATLKRIQNNDAFDGIGRMTELGFLEVDSPAPANVRRDAASHVRRLEESDAQPEFSAASRAGLLALASRCRELGVPLYFSHSPVVRELAESEAFRARFAHNDAIIRQVFAEAGWGEVLFESPAVFEAETMQNADHLTVGSAPEFTSRLTLRVRERIRR